MMSVAANRTIPYYNSIGPYLKELFGCRIMKLAVDGGFTCPNRDGTAGIGGCIFCSEKGSGDFAGDRATPIHEQLDRQVRLLQAKWPSGKYIAYFQNYTNTYAEPAILRARFEEALSYPGVVGLAIATRPDCLGGDILSVLDDLNRKTFLWVELGLQTIHPQTASLINRCYPLEAFDTAAGSLSRLGIRTVVHLILGLPGESPDDMRASARHVAGMDVFGVKLHLLHVLRNTALHTLYEKNALENGSAGFRALERQAYIELVVDILELLPETVTIHRLTGDGPKDLLVEPAWSRDKRAVLNGILREMRERKSRQGCRADHLSSDKRPSL